MTAIKVKFEQITILDFSIGKLSKNQIKQALRKCVFLHNERGAGNEVTVFINYIKVGMYNIRVFLPHDCSSSSNNLKQFGDFQAMIYDSPIDKIPNAHWMRSLRLDKDPRFKTQYWVPKNSFGQLRVTHLIDIIAHCHRLNKLRAFI